MSLALAYSSPAGLEAKTLPVGGKTVLFIGDYSIDSHDFAVLVEYYLQNTDLDRDDPRLQLLECIKSMETKEGFNPPAERLWSPLSSV